MSSSPVAVVVPIYRTELSHEERLALKQLGSVLRNHPICVAIPQSLDVSSLGLDFDRVERFADEYFVSIGSYNRLMLSTEFYDRFARYDYILLYQLDAWVFRDELEYWCAAGYDYIGAPWNHAWSFGQSRAKWLKRGLRRSLAATMGPTTVRRWYKLVYAHRVGNGGLSLRKTSAFTRTLDQNSHKLGAFLYPKNEHYNEDIFYTTIAQRGAAAITAPSWRCAMRFSIETAPRQCLQALGDWPFGCHGWPKWEASLQDELLKTRAF